MVDVAEASKALLDGALIGHIHDDRVRLPQFQLGLEDLALGTAGDRDLRAFVLTQACDGDANPAAATDDHEVATFQLQRPLRWVSRRRRPR
jgi:hypothetical protein